MTDAFYLKALESLRLDLRETGDLHRFLREFDRVMAEWRAR